MIQIEEELTVKENILEIRSAFIECIFEDAKGTEHSRLMKVDLDCVNLADAKASNELLTQFV